MTTRIAVYAGSFDPPTHGHIHIIREALKAFDFVNVYVAVNEAKVSLFTIEERADLVRDCLAENLEISEKDLERIHVHYSTGYVVDYASSIGATALVRGLRNESDLSYEMGIASMNRELNPDLPTVFFPTDPDLEGVSSGKLKSWAEKGLYFPQYCSQVVEAALRKKMFEKSIEEGRV